MNRRVVTVPEPCVGDCEVMVRFPLGNQVVSTTGELLRGEPAFHCVCRTTGTDRFTVGSTDVHAGTVEQSMRLNRSSIATVEQVTDVRHCSGPPEWLTGKRPSNIYYRITGVLVHQWWHTRPPPRTFTVLPWHLFPSITDVTLMHSDVMQCVPALRGAFSALRTLTLRSDAQTLNDRRTMVALCTLLGAKVWLHLETHALCDAFVRRVVKLAAPVVTRIDSLRVFESVESMRASCYVLWFLGTMKGIAGPRGEFGALVRALERAKRRAVEPPPRLPRPIESVPTTTNATYECCVCWERARRVLFMPCLHLATCTVCAPRCNPCPLCKSHIAKRLTVFV